MHHCVPPSGLSLNDSVHVDAPSAIYIVTPQTSSTICWDIRVSIIHKNFGLIDEMWRKEHETSAKNGHHVAPTTMVKMAHIDIDNDTPVSDQGCHISNWSEGAALIVHSAALDKFSVNVKR